MNVKRFSTQDAFEFLVIDVPSQAADDISGFFIFPREILLEKKYFISEREKEVDDRNFDAGVHFCGNIEPSYIYPLI